MDGERTDCDPEESYARPPTIEDLVTVCRSLNEEKAQYAIIGGMALNHYGFVRGTHDIDLLVESSPENMERVIKAPGRLPDGAALEIDPEDITSYSVIRINDVITVDLLGKACNVTYEDAADSLDIDAALGVPIPFASVSILLRTKDTTREADRRDRAFLEDLLLRGTP
ncbi:MAG: hypothetical protein RDV48_24185 [Candidatus Eremiobacteraeota bacterium]|nr:hypothetical protein [Candidatus Eremiobacteraeota bacterium]